MLVEEAKETVVDVDELTVEVVDSELVLVVVVVVVEDAIGPVVLVED